MNEMFNKAAKLAAQNQLDNDQLTVGYVLGQAEKVRIGACPGFMIPVNTPITHSLIMDIAHIYALDWLLYEPDDWRHEYWFFRDRPLMWFINEPARSLAWSLGRGLICGVPFDQIGVT